MGMHDRYDVRAITTSMAKPWILKIHYAHRMPSVVNAYGLYRDRVMVGVVTYGIPASPSLCRGICGDAYRDIVIELNRLVLIDNKKNEASFLVGNSLNMLPQPRIVVSYADTDQNHIGYVYQATNWLYTGATKERTDMYSESGHSRHNDGDPTRRQHRSSKHRYVYFIGNKRQKRKLRKALNYDVYPYPKGDNDYYDVDEVVPQQISLF